MNIRLAHSTMLTEYPDVLDVKQVSDILGVSTKLVYALIRDGELLSLKVGRAFRVPKTMMIQYLLREKRDELPPAN